VYNSAVPISQTSIDYFMNRSFEGFKKPLVFHIISAYIMGPTSTVSSSTLLLKLRPDKPMQPRSATRASPSTTLLKLNPPGFFYVYI
jgi:hypothetical protein